MCRGGSRRAGSRNTDAASGATDDGSRREGLHGSFRRKPAAELDDLRSVRRVSKQQIHFKQAVQRCPPPDSGPPFLVDAKSAEPHVAARARLYNELFHYADPIPNVWDTVHGYQHKNRYYTESALQEPVQANP